MRWSALGFLALMPIGINAQSQATGEKEVARKDTTIVLSSAADSLLFMRKRPSAEAPKPALDGKLYVPPVRREGNELSLRDSKEAYAYDSLWLRELHRNAELYNEMYAGVLTDESELNNLPDADQLNLPTDTLKARLARLNAKTPFNVEYNPSLESVIKLFLTKKKGLMERMLTTSQFYFPLFEQELDLANIPLEIKYLSIVESALNPKAKSRVGATGLWQFMYSTGKMYGLQVSSYVDERQDPIESTQAATQYLSRLYKIFGDWDLALAAYNSGPGNVNKAIRRSGGYRNYWNIRPFLPRETAGYVPAFIATMYVFEYAEEHGLKKRPVYRPYFETDTVQVKTLVTFDQLSKLLNMTKEELEVLNPAYKLGIIPKEANKSYTLRLPIDKLGQFVTNEQEIYAAVQKDMQTREKPLPELTKVQNKIRYRVRKGDYLGKIAERYGVGVSQIKRWNGMRSSKLRIGQRLTIYPRKATVASSSSAKKSTKKSSSKYHIVRSGDSLWTISRKYPGISIQKLREWNGISGSRLIPGTKLKLCDCSS